LTPTIPALACSMTYRAVAPLSVKTDAAFRDFDLHSALAKMLSPG
jgi:hypothetical protein